MDFMQLLGLLLLPLTGLLVLALFYGVPAYILYKLIKHAVKKGTEEANKNRDNDNNCSK